MSRDLILKRLSCGEINVDQAESLLAADESNGKGGVLSCRVGQKGGVSVYGLQRWPVTLYVEQWERLLSFADEIRSFAKKHNAELGRLSEAQRRLRRQARKRERDGMVTRAGREAKNSIDRERFKTMLIRATDGCETRRIHSSGTDSEMLSAIRWALHIAREAADEDPGAIETLEKLANGNTDVLGMKRHHPSTSPVHS